MDEAADLKTDSRHVPEFRFISGQDIIDAGGEVEGVNWSKNKDINDDPLNPNAMYSIPVQGITNEQKASNKIIGDRNELQYQKGEKLLDEAYVLHEENKKRGIHSENFGFNTNPDDLRPTKPREPIEMIDRIKIKNIDMGESTSGPIEPSKRKYIKTKGKNKYIKLETGEVVTIKNPKKKRKGKGDKRSIKNLVTGGTNWVQ